MKEYTNKEAQAICDAIEKQVRDEKGPDAKQIDIFISLHARFYTEFKCILTGSPTLQRDYDRFVAQARERGEI